MSFQDDRGGNRVRESAGPCSGSLHSVWDTCIIHREILNESQSGNQVEGVAEDLRAGITQQQRDGWTKNRVSTWANESYQITIAEETDYCDLEGGSCMYDASTNRTTFSGTQVSAVVDRAYITAKVPIIQDRLRRAGVRLPHLINDALGDEEDDNDDEGNDDQQELLQLLEQVEAAVAELRNSIER